MTDTNPTPTLLDVDDAEIDARVAAMLAREAHKGCITGEVNRFEDDGTVEYVAVVYDDEDCEQHEVSGNIRIQIGHPASADYLEWH